MEECVRNLLALTGGKISRRRWKNIFSHAVDEASPPKKRGPPFDLEKIRAIAKDISADEPLLLLELTKDKMGKRGKKIRRIADRHDVSGRQVEIVRGHMQWLYGEGDVPIKEVRAAIRLGVSDHLANSLHKRGVAKHRARVEKKSSAAGARLRTN